MEEVSEEEVDDDDIEEEEYVKMPEIPPAEKKSAPAKTSQLLTYKPDEVAWIPQHTIVEYSALKHDRLQLSAVMPSSWEGDSKGWKSGFEDNGRTFFVKVPLADAMNDGGHTILSFLEHRHNRLFSEDSSLKKQYRATATQRKGKFATFRVALPFACHEKFSDDFGHPGIEWVNIEETDPTTKIKFNTKILIIEIKSIHKVDIDEDEDAIELTKNTFTPPSKKKATNQTDTEWSKLAMLLEYLVESGRSLDEVRKEVKRQGVDESAMDVDVETFYHQAAAKKQKA